MAVAKPIILPFFRDIDVVQVAVGARHSLALDKEGEIYVMGDNSEE